MIFGKIFLAIILVLAVQVINGSDEDDAKDEECPGYAAGTRGRRSD